MSGQGGGVNLSLELDSCSGCERNSGKKNSINKNQPPFESAIGRERGLEDL